VNGFGNLCAAMEDRERPNNPNVSNKERIYLMDNNATGKKDVVLHVLEKKIVVNGSNEVTSFTPVTDLPLPLVLGAATCLAAENRAVIVVGSNAPGSSETIIDKKTLAILPRRYTLKHGTTPGVTAITSDASGYISVNSPQGFFVLDPNGHGVEEGGGTTYVIPDGNALVIP
jgi:hypothetical protein